MKLYSIYDEVSKTTIFLNLHHNDAEAVRSFRQFASDPRIADKLKDLTLYFLCDFDPSSLFLNNFAVVNESVNVFGQFVFSGDLLKEEY